MKASELMRELAQCFGGVGADPDVGVDVDVVVEVNGRPREIGALEFTDENLITLVLKPMKPKPGRSND